MNDWGLIVDDELKKSEHIRNEIHLDQYIIMPNHVHCIIFMQHGLTGGQPAAPTDNKQKQTLSSFVAGFKSVVTKRINILRNMPGKPVWQRSFHDRIIRNNEELNRVREYIQTNPHNWGWDENNVNP